MNSRGGAALLVVSVLVAVLTACGGSTEDDSSAESTRKGSAKPSPTDEPRESRVDLLDPGAAPRRALRLRPETGDVQRSLMTLDTDVAITVDGRRSPAIDAPPMVMGMRVEVEEVRPDGVIESTFGYDSARVEGSGAQADQLEEFLVDNLLGVSGEMEVTDTGEFLDGDMDLPFGMEPSMRAMMRSIESEMGNLTVPLPAGKVGLGAVWTSRSRSAVNGIEVDNVYRFELLERSGDRVVLAVSMKGTAPEQDPDLPGLGADETIHLERMVLSASGRSVLDLTSLLPVSSRSASTGEIKMTIESGGTTSVMLQKLRTRTELAPR